MTRPPKGLEKTSLDSLANGVFSIIMTILVIDFKIPNTGAPMDSFALAQSVFHLWPLFFSYVLSFGVLTSFWISHHYLINLFSRNVNRTVVYLDMFFLMWLALIPFTSNIIGLHGSLGAAMAIYGAHLLVIAFSLLALMEYIILSKEIHNTMEARKNARYSKIRIWMIIILTAIGVAMSFVSTVLAGFFYLVPIVIGVIPGLVSRLDNTYNRIRGNV